MKLATYLKESKTNLQLAWPVILGMIGHTLVGIVDNVMVGKLGAKELAAVSLGNSFIFVAMSLGIGFSTAITPLVAEADAQNDKEKSKAVFLNGLLLCSLLGLILFILVFLSKPILNYMGQPEEVVTLAIPYLHIVGFSLVPLIIFQGYKQFSDGKSKTKYAMWATILGNIVNIFINYILIYGKLGFPAMGIAGAAIGTLVSRIVMVVFIHKIMATNIDFKYYFTKVSTAQIHKKILYKIINLGTPSAMQMFFEVGLFTGAIWLCGIIGTTSQAANQIALSLASFTFMFALGLSVAAMIRVGNLKGLHDYVNLKRVAISIFLLTIIIEVVFALAFIIFHKHLPLLFLNIEQIALTDTKEVITIASRLLIVAALFQLFDGIQVVVLGALRGLQDMKIPMYITFIAYWIIGFPISIYLGLATPLKATGVWIGLLAGLLAAAVLLYTRFNNIIAKNSKKVPL